MSLAAAVARLLGLPPARTTGIEVRRGVGIPMPDRTRLLADHYYPRDEPHAPVVLMRTPYDRGGAYALLARIIAGRGYQVLIQNLRGTGGSGGRFTGFTLHPGDGTATIAWLRNQHWFPGTFATWGTSYLGYAQWDLATEHVPEWRAAVIQDAPSELYHSFCYPGGAFALGNAVTWIQAVDAATRGRLSIARQTVNKITASRSWRRAVDAAPISEADRIAVGHPVSYFQEWLHHPDPDDYWAAMDHRGNAENMPPTVHLAGGWYDLFLPRLLDDHTRLTRAGRDVRLLIGPWAHGRAMMGRVYLRDALAVLDHALRGDDEPRKHPVRLFRTGIRRWADFDTWPPPSHQPTRWYLHGEGRLDRHPPRESSVPTRHHYDPAAPTPTIGGTQLGTRGGPRDNRRLESRPDVVTFTSTALTANLETIGPVTAEIHLRTSHPHVDLFARLCDVAPNGRSTNLCDGIIRLRPDQHTNRDGTHLVRVALWPTAHTFRTGHRVRLQLAGGAHPRFNPNLGTAQSIGSSAHPSDHEIFHDRAHPSALLLPVAG